MIYLAAFKLIKYAIEEIKVDIKFVQKSGLTICGIAIVKGSRILVLEQTYGTCGNRYCIAVERGLNSEPVHMSDINNLKHNAAIKLMYKKRNLCLT